MEEKILGHDPDEDDEAPAERSGKVRVLHPASATSAAAVPPQYRFLTHNRALRHKLEHWQTRQRRNDFGDLDQALCAAYALRLEAISSREGLRWLREPGRPESLCLSETELTRGRRWASTGRRFPMRCPSADSRCRFPTRLRAGRGTRRRHRAPALHARGKRLRRAPRMGRAGVAGEEKINELLRALPKAIRRDLMPLAPKVAEIVRDFAPSGTSLLRDLGRFLEQRYRVAVPESAWPADALPAHLRTRIEVVGRSEKPLAASRDLEQLRQHFAQRQKQSEPTHEPVHWQRAAQRVEQFGLRGWTFGDLPERITVVAGPGLPLYGWPGLQCEEGGVSVRLFRSRDAAQATSLFGVQRLVELALQERPRLGQERPAGAGGIRVALRAPRLAGGVARDGFGQRPAPGAARRTAARANPRCLRGRRGGGAAATARRAAQLHERIGTVLRLYQQTRVKLGPAPAAKPPPPPPRSGIRIRLGRPARSLAPTAGASALARAGHPVAAELAALVPPRFLERVPSSACRMSAFLKALLIRAERPPRLESGEGPRARHAARALAGGTEATRSAA